MTRPHIFGFQPRDKLPYYVILFTQNLHEEKVWMFSNRGERCYSCPPVWPKRMLKTNNYKLEFKMQVGYFKCLALFSAHYCPLLVLAKNWHFFSYDGFCVFGMNVVWRRRGFPSFRPLMRMNLWNVHKTYQQRKASLTFSHSYGFAIQTFSVHRLLEAVSHR